MPGAVMPRMLVTVIDDEEDVRVNIISSAPIGGITEYPHAVRSLSLCDDDDYLSRARNAVPTAGISHGRYTASAWPIFHQEAKRSAVIPRLCLMAMIYRLAVAVVPMAMHDH